VRGRISELRGVPWSSRAHFAVHNWLKSRYYLRADHDRPWRNLHAAPSARLPMTRWTFDKLLGVYVGSEWSYSRLRITAAVMWARCGLPLERLRELQGWRGSWTR
jgi:hypothetical protein